MSVNRQFVLASRPTGMPAESNFNLIETPIPALKDGEFLARAMYLSVDPYMRGRISGGRSYAAGVEVGGLMVAGELLRHGATCRIVDRNEGPANESRALGVQARTLELYSQLDLDQAVIERGHKVPAVNLWVGGKPKAHLDFTDIGSGLTPYAFLLIFPQDEHEELLIERLGELGIVVERQDITPWQHFLRWRLRQLALKQMFDGFTDHLPHRNAQQLGRAGAGLHALAAIVHDQDGVRLV